MAKQVRTVYGQALFDAARESGRLTEVREQAEVIVSALEENPDFLRILTHPEITLPEKQAMVDGVFAGKPDSLTCSSDQYFHAYSIAQFIITYSLQNL